MQSTLCPLLCSGNGVGMMCYMQDNKIIDTSAADARKGKDIQGIPWERLSISRERYRQTRLEQYKNYENVPQSGESSEKVKFLYFFFSNSRSVNIIPVFL